MRSFSDKQIFIFSVIIVIAINVFLKLWSITASSLNLDEAFSIFYAQKSNSDLWKLFDYNGNPPLYYYSLKAWMSCFGNSVFSTRFLSFLANLGNILAVMFMAKKYLNLLTAIGAGLLLSILNLQLFFAQEVRVYSLLGLLSVLSVWVFIRFLSHPSKKEIFLLAIANAALLYAHYASLVLPLVQGIIILFYIRTPKIALRFAISQVIALILAVPSLLLINFDTISSSWSWLTTPDLNQTLILFTEFTNSSISLVASGIFLLAGLVYSFFPNIDKSKKRFFLIFAALGLLSILVNFLISQKVVLFSSRYLFFTQQFTIIALFLGISILPFRKLYKIILSGLLIASFIPGIQSKTTSEDWKSVVSYTNEFKPKGYTVLVSPSYMSMPYAYYYNREIFSHYDTHMRELYDEDVICIKLIGPDFFDFQFPEKLLFVASHEAYVDPKSHNLITLNERYDFVDVKHFAGINVFQFIKKRPDQSIDTKQ